MKQRAQVELQAEHSGHLDSVYTLAQSRAPGHFLSAGADGIVAEWDAHTLQSTRALLRANRAIYALQLVAHKGWLLVGQNDGGLHILDVPEQRLLKSVQIHRDAIFDLQAVPGGRTFLSASRDGNIGLWRIEDLECVLTAKVARESLRSVVLNPDGELLAVGSSDNKVRIYQAENLQKIRELNDFTNSVFRCVFSPDGRWLLAVGRDAHLRVYDTEDDFALAVDVVAHHFAINDLVYRPDGNYFATASMDKTIKLWDAESFRLLKVLDYRRNNAHQSSVNRLLWLEEPDCLVSVSDDNRVLQWKIDFYVRI